MVLTLRNPWVLVVFVLAGTYAVLRLFLGVEFFDEPYSASFAWRFALGDRPFIDDRSMHQNFGVLLTPLVWTYSRVFGSEGLLLFLRSVFLLCEVGLAGCTYAFARRRLETAPAAVLSLFVFLSPVAGTNFSYNAFGVLGFFLGLLLLDEALRSGRALLFAAAGFAHGLCMASHPTQIPACVLVGLFLLYPLRASLRGIAAYAAQVAVIGLAYLLGSGFSGLVSLWEYKEQLAHSELSVDFFRHLRNLLAVPLRPLWLAVFALMLFADWKRHETLRRAAPWVVALSSLTIVLLMGYGAGFYFTYFGLAGIALFWLGRRGGTEVRLLWLLWLPAVLSSILFTWGGNFGGISRFGLGMFPGVVAGLLWGCALLPSARARSTYLASLFAILLGLHARDSRRLFQGFSQSVSQGPYLGLRTSEKQAAWLERLQTQVLAHAPRHAQILFHPHFPAGYLMTSLRPAALNTWWTYFDTPRARQNFLQEYEARSAPGTLVVIVKQLYYSDSLISPAGVGLAHRDLLGDFITRTHRRLYSSPEFDIYERI